MPSPFETRYLQRTLTPTRNFRRAVAAAALVLLGLSLGCRDDAEVVRQIQTQRQARMQTEAEQDHLGEVFSLLDRFVELNPETSRRQIAYHLNRWSETRSTQKTFDVPAEAHEILKTVSHVIPESQAVEHVARANFVASDVDHLRDSFLFHEVVEWVDSDNAADPLLVDWFATLAEQRSAEAVVPLKIASRLFDWTVRNIALEPLIPADPAPPAPEFPLGMSFRGPGYRQSNYQTLWYGTGDALQRAGVFTQLCRQASVPAAVLALPSESGELRPWCVGVAVGEEIYLFEPGLGIFIPGPDQVGIATLEQARKDPSVMRRLNVAGFFDYPFSQNDVQQCVALLNVAPESLSPRMRELEQGLTGDRRMIVHVDAVAFAKQLDAISGIAGVRMWDVPLLAEVYRVTLEQAAERDPMLAFWYLSRWAIIDAEAENSRRLAKGRWAHLRGQFEDDDVNAQPGARTLYLSQRAPEFEIEDLRIDVELQMQYGIRRDLGIAPEVYDRQVQQIQMLMRQGKRTATYWLSLVQYEDGRYETAANWFQSRVLVEDQRSHWEPAARYNLGRCLERVGETDRAIELYKTSGDLQEHGTRLRARLLDRLSPDEAGA